MVASFILLVLVLGGLAAPPPGLAVEYLTFGGSGRSWTSNSLVFNALEDLGGSLGPLEADSTENLLPRVEELGGSAVTSVAAAAARSNQILRELTDGDHTTGWRVYSDPNGAELSLDMGAVFILSRIRMLRGVLTSDERSLRGYELYANDGDSLNFIGAEPIYSLIAQDRSHGAPELDVRFDPQPVRFLKLRSTGERPFQMGDMEVFGVGVTPFAHYISKVIDLGAPATFGPVQVYARMVGDRARLRFSTKTGVVPDDSLYLKQTGIPGEYEEVPKDQFDRTLDPSYAGIVRVNARDWSAWSPPYPYLEGALSSPDNRRYAQFEFRFISNGLRDKVIIDSLRFAYTVPAIADSVVAEISPATAALGRVNEFSYHLRMVTSRNRRGFDTVLIATPFKAEARAVEVDGVAVPFTQEADEHLLKVVFPGDRVERTGQEVAVRFACLVAVSGTEFRGQVGDSQSDAFPQRLIGADADPQVESNTLVVGARIEDRLFTEVQVSSGAFTPNGDGANDALKLDYILLKATSPVQVEVSIHDLAGTLVRHLYRRRDLSGPNAVQWDGRDDEEKLVPPGLYLLRLSVETDAGETARLHIIAVAY